MPLCHPERSEGSAVRARCRPPNADPSTPPRAAPGAPLRMTMRGQECARGVRGQGPQPRKACPIDT